MPTEFYAKTTGEDVVNLPEICGNGEKMVGAALFRISCLRAATAPATSAPILLIN
jgi:hypothetical protein